MKLRFVVPVLPSAIGSGLVIFTFRSSLRILPSPVPSVMTSDSSVVNCTVASVTFTVKTSSASSSPSPAMGTTIWALLWPFRIVTMPFACPV